MSKVRIGICGWGNLGKSTATEIVNFPDFELVAIFTRRNPGDLEIGLDVPVIHMDSILDWKNKIDVMMLCGGSKKDLPKQAPELAKHFNTVDSYDTHTEISDFLKAVDSSAKLGNNISVISTGWDPGIFSILKLYMGEIVPTGKTYSFWGPGLSQGHTNAIKQIEGVENAVQYTIPIESAMDLVRSTKNPDLAAKEKHERICYVVAKEPEQERIAEEIKQIPLYFADYDTVVNFVSNEELEKNHSKLMHGGNVIHTGKTGNNNKQVVEFSLKLDSNPEFTASVLLAYARATYKLSQKGQTGARTVFDIPPILLTNSPTEEIIRNLL
ncbi:MAG: diaminopimelate dehydrogenase [Oscillospiraceae bacterium]|nr:diaminopimelate dehydrogenase [Oscillospiraceae bacterium]